ncbi:MAG: peptidase inhibitor family I36 protein [Acidimicrobiales bacterium]
MKRSITKVAAAALATIAAGGTTLATSGPASADHIPCPSGRACIWGGTGWQSDGRHDWRHSFVNYDTDFSNNHYGGTAYFASNNASSMSNKGDFDTVYFYNGASCTGDVWSWGKNTGDKNLSDGPAGSNNVFSSGAFESFKSSC